jgi:hypothetical protein
VAFLWRFNILALFDPHRSNAIQVAGLYNLQLSRRRHRLFFFFSFFVLFLSDLDIQYAG